MFVSPMLLHKIEKPFNGENYIAELKLDGIRAIFSTMGEKSKLYTRHKNDISARFGELLSYPLPAGTILDGELVVTDEAGKPDFESCMQRFFRSKGQITYCVFDILYYKGKDVTSLPLEQRKLLLFDVLPDDSPLIAKVKSLSGLNSEQLFSLCCSQSLEGIFLKRKDSAYMVGQRSKNWLKVINYSFEDVLITGYRKSKFGWILNFDTGLPAGTLEFAPSHARQKVYSMAHNSKYEEYGDFVRFPADPIKAKVKFRNYTKAGLLRTPSFEEFL
ncbi:ATP-dependent DNA ligase [Fictibacillus terranigra]|uniref:ATP-dependent DNA ligase n=1 Tax=Fictibacillus terranigra TaxID=3058424 RepID=A0ABT8ED89_9BACL|nr:ATP-dependent DNA ligase [Fictibacillus sp. CENA-BCM004]MDN4075902.1 ATP-dependent DNA ligase [Fictibacillus sp. CENA-BCM004]